MRQRRVLVAISAAQLSAGIAGQLIALRDGRSFDIALVGWRGQPDQVLRDSWLIGTGLSAPVVMLTAQAIATLRLAAGPNQRARRTLGALGAVMTCGYLVEREFRSSLSPASWDPLATPIAAVAFPLAVAMAVSGVPRSRALDEAMTGTMGATILSTCVRYPRGQ